MIQFTYTYKDYAKRIVKALKEENPEKYRALRIKSVENHLLHLNQGIINIILTGNDELKTPFFNLSRGFARFNNFIFMNKRYQAKRMLELANRVHKDNIIDQLSLEYSIDCSDKVPSEFKDFIDKL